MGMFVRTIDDPQDRGYITYFTDEVGITISTLRVYEPHRMKGIGGELLKQVLDEADKKGLDVYLYVQPLDSGPTTLPFIPLRDFYYRRGFQERFPGSYERLVRRPVLSGCTIEEARASLPKQHLATEK